MNLILIGLHPMLVIINQEVCEWHLSDDGDIFHMEGLASMLPECDTRTTVDLMIVKAMTASH